MKTFFSFYIPAFYDFILKLLCINMPFFLQNFCLVLIDITDCSCYKLFDFKPSISCIVHLVEFAMIYILKVSLVLVLQQSKKSIANFVSFLALPSFL